MNLILTGLDLEDVKGFDKEAKCNIVAYKLGHFEGYFLPPKSAFSFFYFF